MIQIKKYVTKYSIKTLLILSTSLKEIMINFWGGVVGVKAVKWVEIYMFFFFSLRACHTDELRDWRRNNTCVLNLYVMSRWCIRWTCRRVYACFEAYIISVTPHDYLGYSCCSRWRITSLGSINKQRHTSMARYVAVLVVVVLCSAGFLSIFLFAFFPPFSASSLIDSHLLSFLPSFLKCIDAGLTSAAEQEN